MTICRVTQFKIPSEEGQKQLLEVYSGMQRKALKDGKPYILSVRAGSTVDDPRRQGYTVAVVTEFASMEDMEYYDTECVAHKNLKVVAGKVHEGVMTAFFEPIAMSNL
ncbi:hypothetical protein FQN57_002634 [Myotisia sp. PD_48]|nr:hypothetical protein FQN57_002634 [Myotisia sp. PD_48]